MLQRCGEALHLCINWLRTPLLLSFCPNILTCHIPPTNNLDCCAQLETLHNSKQKNQTKVRKIRKKTFGKKRTWVLTEFVLFRDAELVQSSWCCVTPGRSCFWTWTCQKCWLCGSFLYTVHAVLGKEEAVWVTNTWINLNRFSNAKIKSLIYTSNKKFLVVVCFWVNLNLIVLTCKVLLD